jgi:hypothetical protein
MLKRSKSVDKSCDCILLAYVSELLYDLFCCWGVSIGPLIRIILLELLILDMPQESL